MADDGSVLPFAQGTPGASGNVLAMDLNWFGGSVAASAVARISLSPAAMARWRATLGTAQPSRDLARGVPLNSDDREFIADLVLLGLIYHDAAVPQELSLEPLPLREGDAFGDDPTQDDGYRGEAFPLARFFLDGEVIANYFPDVDMLGVSLNVNPVDYYIARQEQPGIGDVDLSNVPAAPAPMEAAQVVADMAASGVVGSVAYAAVSRLRQAMRWPWRRPPARARAQQIASEAIRKTFGERLPRDVQPTVESFSVDEWQLVYTLADATYTVTGKGTSRRSVAITRAPHTDLF